MSDGRNIVDLNLQAQIRLLLRKLEQVVADSGDYLGNLSNMDEMDFPRYTEIISKFISTLDDLNVKQELLDTYTEILDCCQLLIRGMSDIRLEDAYGRVLALMRAWKDIHPELKKAQKKPVVMNRYVSSLLTAGRICTDQYRATSDIAYHLRGMHYEINAVRTAVFDLPDVKQYQTARARALINCALSSYRLKAYGLALPLSDMACQYASDKSRKSNIDETQYRVIIRNRAVILYSAGVDKYVAFPPDLSRTAGVEHYFEMAVFQAEENKKHCINEEWNSNIRIAISRLQQVRYVASKTKKNSLLDVAADLLENVLRKITYKIANEEIECRPQVSRLYECERYLAEVYTLKSQLDYEDEAICRQMLYIALLHAKYAFLFEAGAQNWSSLDLRKAYKRYKDIEMQFERIEPEWHENRPAVCERFADLKVSKEELRTFDKIYDQENLDVDRLFVQQRKQYEDRRERVDVLDSVTIVNDIVRHEPVSLNDYFGSCRWREALGFPDDFLEI